MAGLTLRSNEIYAALSNMIISQQVFADNIKGSSDIVDKARVDGSMYGDTKLFYASDALSSSAWGNDAEAQDLLKLYRPKSPAVQPVYLDQFRQICLTVDNYLSKRAWSTEGAFASFASVMLGWIADTKRIYDRTLYKSFIGTTSTSVGDQLISIDLATPTTGLTGNEAARVRAQTIAQVVADLLTALQDETRDYNDYGYIRSYDKSDLMFVWSSKYVNEITKLDLPTIFNDNIMDKFAENVLPAKYFGTPNDASHTLSVAGDRALTEVAFKVLTVDHHYFAGEELPVGVTLVDDGDIIIPTYATDDKVICKVYHNGSVPFMSAFEVGTSFYNTKALTETNYLTWGHNTLDYLKNYPFITIAEAPVVVPET